MTQSSENSLQRAFATVDDRQTRDAKALREEISSLRQALHAMNAPSSTLQSLDSRVDALRNDVQEMFETVAALKRNEPRQIQDTRREVNAALETARSEITRNVGVQLQQFDGTLSELHRESLLRSQELTSLQMRLDQAIQSGAIGGNSGFNANTMMMSYQQQQQNNNSNNLPSGVNSTPVTTSYGARTSSSTYHHHPQSQPVVASSSNGAGLTVQANSSRSASLNNNNNNAANLTHTSGVAPPPTAQSQQQLPPTGAGSRTPSTKRDALQGAFDV
jgi:hypothetical protein